jgi:hypothetical protein
VSPSEIGFLALGLALGITAGAVLLAVVRPRSPLRPVVRVTVTPNAIKPRETQPGIRARPDRLSEFAPGSPDEDAYLGLPVSRPGGGGPAGRPMPPAPHDSRTRVLAGPAAMPTRTVGIPIVGGNAAASGPVASARPAVAVAERPDARPDPLADDLLAIPTRVDADARRSAVPVRARPPAFGPLPELAADVVAIPIIAGRAPRGGSSRSAKTTAATTADTCASERSQAAATCAEADAAREAARNLADRLREAQRAHADLEARVEEAGALADPRRLAAEKERLHAQFKAAHSDVASPEDAELAARDWLTAVSVLNSTAQDAVRRVQAGTDQLRSQAAALQRLDLEANAGRITAERAQAACRAAREALAACEERLRPVTTPEELASPLDAHWPGDAEPAFDRGSPGSIDAARAPLILRVLRGDTAAREQLVASLAGADAVATAEWHMRIAKFVDAVTARAIEDGYLDTDEEHPFWRLFGSTEQQEIVQALSALGFRFDGMRGFTDDRVPAARDLSLAVGYAGIDRMRIRVWPGEAALAALYDGASVRADLWLANQADDLSLARVEAALGTRAAGLADLWDAWGRVRPAMLAER